MSADHIRVTSVSKTFRTSGGALVRALDDISLTIGEGQFVSIVGPSGCGKSTLLNLMAGLEPVTRGEVHLAGSPVREPRRDISIVFQSPVLLPWRRVLDNVLLPIELGPSRMTKAHRTRAADVLEMVGLGGFEHAYPQELSGGMQQRCAIARALMLDAQVLLMDEPFGSLDALTREQLNLEIQDIWLRTGTTVVLITHDIDEAVLLSDRILVMSKRPGRVLREFDVTTPRPRGLGVSDELETARLSAAIREQLGVGRPPGPPRPDNRGRAAGYVKESSDVRQPQRQHDDRPGTRVRH